MIILSQDREKIINFDNIDSIEVDANVIVVFKNNKRIWIGTYDTIIRAKEILKDFYEYYSRMKYKDGVSFEKGLLTILGIKNGLFVMPEK